MWRLPIYLDFAVSPKDTETRRNGCFRAQTRDLVFMSHLQRAEWTRGWLMRAPERRTNHTRTTSPSLRYQPWLISPVFLLKRLLNCCVLTQSLMQKRTDSPDLFVHLLQMALCHPEPTSSRIKGGGGLVATRTAPLAAAVGKEVKRRRSAARTRGRRQMAGNERRRLCGNHRERFWSTGLTVGGGGGFSITSWFGRVHRKESMLAIQKAFPCTRPCRNPRFKPFSVWALQNFAVSVPPDLWHDLYQTICSGTDSLQLRLAVLSLIIFPMVPGHRGMAGSDQQVKGREEEAKAAGQISHCCVQTTYWEIELWTRQLSVKRWAERWPAWRLGQFDSPNLGWQSCSRVTALDCLWGQDLDPEPESDELMTGNIIYEQTIKSNGSAVIAACITPPGMIRTPALWQKKPVHLRPVYFQIFNNWFTKLVKYNLFCRAFKAAVLPETALKNRLSPVLHLFPRRLSTKFT